ncbi:uncharacterized protein LOC128083394 isoform X5 [Tympanuchus pallidicinctus]|uniref:uncharacterized protein LOC128083394 isoform X5 n=1 Tax=Tympanuchus pallidicinctus TaxID=109042 RepID=UPI002287333F|nr:uncharacterized protein LOC128083394 isoform X5 [Tympanuchus pallidicinctus]
MDALHLLEKQKDKKPFEVSLREAIQMIWVKLSQLEQAPACIPPCGHQPAARIFQCSTCRLVDCQFPVDCPGLVGPRGRSHHAALRRALRRPAGAAGYVDVCQGRYSGIIPQSPTASWSHLVTG